MNRITEKLKEGPLLLDGAMGTYYTGLTKNVRSTCEAANITEPDIILGIHREYIAAGADAITTNTFGINRKMLGDDEADRLICKGWQIANEAVKGTSCSIFASIGPASGITDPAETAAEYIRNAETFLELGTENFVFETNTSAAGLKEAARYIKGKKPDAFVMVNFAVLAGGFTAEGLYAGDIVKSMAEESSIDAVGFNCGSSAGHLSEIVETICRNDQLNGKYLAVLPNAGYPVVIGKRTFYEGDPYYFACRLKDMTEYGAKIIGGCCGTTPAHIAEARKLLDQEMLPEISAVMEDTAGTGNRHGQEIHETSGRQYDNEIPGTSGRQPDNEIPGSDSKHPDREELAEIPVSPENTSEAGKRPDQIISVKSPYSASPDNGSQTDNEKTEKPDKSESGYREISVRPEMPAATETRSGADKEKEEIPAGPESIFWQKLSSGERVIAVELDPPVDVDLRKFSSGVHDLKNAGADIITIADCPVGRACMDSSLLACKVYREMGMEALPHMTCRDRNLNATKALMMGIYAEGIRNVLLVTGDPVPTAQRDEVKSVFQFNSRKLARFTASLNELVFPTPLHIFGALNLNARNFNVQLGLAKEKEKEGMIGFLTQPVLTSRAFENLKAARKELKGFILGGIIPVVSEKNAMFMENEINGINVDPKITAMYHGKDRQECEELAVNISTEIANRIRDYIDGYYLMTPFSRTGIITRIIDNIQKNEL